MAASKRQSHQRQGESKLFHCTGFGDCNMVFTRSEHLARHARKHTGEKPFKCVVPGCERAFSRFDNMVQHTSTHSKNQDKKRTPGKKQNKTKLSKVVVPRIDGSVINDTSETKSSKILDKPSSPPMSTSSPSPSTHISLPDSPLLPDMDLYQYHRQQLPPITESIYYQSPKTPTADYFPPPYSSKTAPHHHYSTSLPSPRELDLHLDSSLLVPSSGLPISHGLNPPSLSVFSSMCPSSLPSLSPDIFSRKLSQMELSLPIQELSVNHGVGNIGVDVTLDEFEALQGMSRLSAETLALPRHLYSLT